MSFKYMTGEDVRKGDCVTFHGEPSRVEFVAEPSIKDTETSWYVKEYGGGVMILEPRAFGRAFLRSPATMEDLILFSREDGTSSEQLSQTGLETEN
jgi:hypothetical protein